jgi:hypothetical protein
MLTKFKLTLGAALIAASQLAAADVAEVKISDLQVSVGAPAWYAWAPFNVDWASKPTFVETALQAPSLTDHVESWQGVALTSTVTDGTSHASVVVTDAVNDWNGHLNGVTASAAVDVVGGQSGWANAKLYAGNIQVGGSSTITVSFKIDKLLASGSMAQAGATISFCSLAGVCDVANYAEALVDQSWPDYTGPSVLSAQWTNLSANGQDVKLYIELTASANSVAAVPEPSTAALWLAGLLGAGALARRRRQH